jgi:hypothetical protein
VLFPIENLQVQYLVRVGRPGGQWARPPSLLQRFRLVSLVLDVDSMKAGITVRRPLLVAVNALQSRAVSVRSRQRKEERQTPTLESNEPRSGVLP